MVIDLISFSLIILVGSLTGFLSGFLGVGGGFVLVPLLIIVGVPAHVAIGSSLVYIVLVGVTGAVQHYRLRNCSIRMAVYMLIGGAIMAQIGAIATSYLDTYVLEMLLSLVLVATSVRMLFAEDKEMIDYGEACETNIPILVLIGSIAGFLSGLLGL